MPWRTTQGLLAVLLLPAALYRCDATLQAPHLDGNSDAPDAHLQRPDSQRPDVLPLGDLTRPDAGRLSAALELTYGSPVGLGARALCFDGERYFVGWAERPLEGSGEELYAAVLDAAGTVLQPARQVRDSEEGRVCELSVHCTGDKQAILVYRQDISGADSIYALRLDGEAAVVTPATPLTTCDTHSSSWGLSVARGQDLFGVLFAKRVDGTFKQHLLLATTELSVVLEPTVIAPSGTVHQICPSVLALTPADQGHQTFWLYWTQSSRLYTAVAQATPSGETWTIDAGAPARVFTHTEREEGGQARGDGTGAVLFSWNGADWWNQPRLVYHPHEQPAWPEPLALVGEDNRFERMRWAAALDGDQVVIAWEGNSKTPLPQIYARHLDLSLTADAIQQQVADQPAVQLSDALFDANDPAVGGGQSSWAVVFSVVRDGTEKLYFRRL